jgi:hypothetical protein
LILVAVALCVDGVNWSAKVEEAEVSCGFVPNSGS